jgi:hypothetical protein
VTPADPKAPAPKTLTAADVWDMAVAAPGDWASGVAQVRAAAGQPA